MPEGSHRIVPGCRNEADVFVEDVTGRPQGGVSENEIEGNTTMNQPVIEAHARYLIEDRIHATRRTQSAHVRRHHRRLRILSWL